MGYAGLAPWGSCTTPCIPERKPAESKLIQSVTNTQPENDGREICAYVRNDEEHSEVIDLGEYNIDGGTIEMTAIVARDPSSELVSKMVADEFELRHESKSRFALPGHRRPTSPTRGDELMLTPCRPPNFTRDDFTPEPVELGSRLGGGGDAAQARAESRR